MMQGLSPRGGVRRKHGTNVRVDGQKPNRRETTQPTFQTRTSRNDGGQSSADSLTQGQVLCISRVSETPVMCIEREVERVLEQLYHTVLKANAWFPPVH